MCTFSANTERRTETEKEGERGRERERKRKRKCAADREASVVVGKLDAISI